MHQPVFHGARSIDDATDAGRERIQRGAYARQKKHGRHGQLDDLRQVGDMRSGVEHADLGNLSEKIPAVRMMPLGSCSPHCNLPRGRRVQLHKHATEDGSMQNKFVIALAVGTTMALLLASPLLRADERGYFQDQRHDPRRKRPAGGFGRNRQWLHPARGFGARRDIETVSGSIDIGHDSTRQRHQYRQRQRDPGSQHQGRFG